MGLDNRVTMSSVFLLVLAALLFGAEAQDCGAVFCPSILPCLTRLCIPPSTAVCALSSVVVNVSSFSSLGVPAACPCKCESQALQVLVSYFSTFGQLLGSFLASPGRCANGVTSFSVFPTQVALHTLDVWYQGAPVPNNSSCPCPAPPGCACPHNHTSTGLVVASCYTCSSPDLPCGVASARQYDQRNAVPGGNQIVFDFDK